MLVCIYRTYTTVIDFNAYINNMALLVVYTISRDIYLKGDARQMILDILIWIKSYVDRTLSFRSSCCEGVCGSCAMLINNTNTLACIQPIWLIDSYVTIYPLPHFNVVRDLVIDLKHFYEQYAYVNPFYGLYDASGFSDSCYSTYALSCVYYHSILIPCIYSLKSSFMSLSGMRHVVYLLLYIAFSMFCGHFVNINMGYYIFFNINIHYITI